MNTGNISRKLVGLPAALRAFGGVGILLIASDISTLGAVGTRLVIGGCLVVAAIIAQFGTAMRDKRLDEVSP